MYQLDYHLCSSATPLDWLLSRNLKRRKLILRAFSDFPRKLPAIRYYRGAINLLHGSTHKCSHHEYWLSITYLVVLVRIITTIHVCQGNQVLTIATESMDRKYVVNMPYSKYYTYFLYLLMQSTMAITITNTSTATRGTATQRINL